MNESGLYPNLRALAKDPMLVSLANPELQREAKSAVSELAKYATLVERCRFDITRGCWCGVHILPVSAAQDLSAPRPEGSET